MMRVLESREDYDAVNAAEPDPLLAFASEIPAADAGTYHAAFVRFPSADAAPAKCAQCLGAERKRRNTPKQAFRVAAAALAVVAIWGSSPVLAPVSALRSRGTQQAVGPSAARPPSAPGDASVAPARSRSLPSEGQLVVISDPPGARVIVDGIGWGDTPLTLRYLPLGDKRVVVRRPGYVRQERSVRLEPERNSATVRVTLSPQPSADDPSRK